MLSPDLLEKFAPIDSPADLLELPLIDPTDDWWPEWFAEAGVPAPDLSKLAGMRVMNQQLAGRAALSGQGVAILMPAFFAEELASGRLVQPFPIVRRVERSSIIGSSIRRRAGARRRSARSATGFLRRSPRAR